MNVVDGVEADVAVCGAELRQFGVDVGEPPVDLPAQLRVSHIDDRADAGEAAWEPSMLAWKVPQVGVGEPHADLAALFAGDDSTFGLGVEGLESAVADEFGEE